MDKNVGFCLYITMCSYVNRGIRIRFVDKSQIKNVPEWQKYELKAGYKNMFFKSKLIYHIEL